MLVLVSLWRVLQLRDLFSSFHKHRRDFQLLYKFRQDGGQLPPQNDEHAVGMIKKQLRKQDDAGEAWVVVVVWYTRLGGAENEGGFVGCESSVTACWAAQGQGAKASPGRSLNWSLLNFPLWLTVRCCVMLCCMYLVTEALKSLLAQRDVANCGLRKKAEVSIRSKAQMRQMCPQTNLPFQECCGRKIGFAVHSKGKRQLLHAQ